jgi:hypothetical protein
LCAYPRKESALALEEEPAGSAEAIWIAGPVLNAEAAKEENPDHSNRFEKCPSET